MELITERLKLVPCTEETVLQYACSLDDTTSHVKHCLNKLKEDENCAKGQTWLLIDKNKGIVVGEIVVTRGVQQQGSVHVNYNVLSYARNKGYAVEALKKVFSWCFKHGGVRTIEAECAKGDIYTEMVLTYLGMNRKEENPDKTDWELKKEASELVT